MKKTYAYYKGDKYICSGTLKELAERFKVTPRTIYFYTTMAYQKRNKSGNRIIVIQEEDYDE